VQQQTRDVAISDAAIRRWLGVNDAQQAHAATLQAGGISVEG
jgi:hypothetical protein